MPAVAQPERQAPNCQLSSGPPAPLVQRVHSLAFPKTRRLLNATEVQQVFDQVDCKQGGKFFTLLSRGNQLERSRLGIVVAKRHVKTAVGRNAIKRRIRETFRVCTADGNDIVQHFDVIVIAKPGCAGLSKHQITAELNRQWAKLVSKRKAAQDRTAQGEA